MNQITKSLCHGATSSKKRAYNKDYYQAHKDYWKDYYSKGMTIGRSGRDKYTSGNSTGVARRGNGLGRGPVGRKRETIIPETILTETILTEHGPDVPLMTDQQFSSQMSQMNNFLNSSTFKKQLKQGVQFLKKHAGDMINMGMKFAKAFLKEWFG